MCGPNASPDFAEPPVVDVGSLPRDAAGKHELILAVHRDGRRYCYSYGSLGALRRGSPTIRVRRGETFAMRIVNDIASQAKGEDVPAAALPPCGPAMPSMHESSRVAHYVGYLDHIMVDHFVPMTGLDTNIHLHGFQGPPSEEDIFLSTLSTPMHACEYAITIPRTQPPGTYFYHPHAHGSSYREVSTGLSGVWIVEPDRPQIAPSADHVVVLQYAQPFAVDNAFAPDSTPIDIASAAYEGSLKPAPPVAYDPFAPPPWPFSFAVRAGSIRLDPTGCNGPAAETEIAVGGAAAPATLDVPGGQTQLLRIVNGTSDSSKLLSLRDDAGTPVPLRIVGRDGIPVSGDDAAPLSGYLSVDRAMVVPMGRIDALVTLAPGRSLVLSSEHFCQGADGFYQLHHDLLKIVASDGPALPAGLISRPIDVARTPAAELVAYAKSHPSKIRRRAITFTEYAIPAAGKVPAHAAFFITDTTDPHFHEHPFQPRYAPGATVPDNPDVVVKAGTIEEWYLINTTMETHVFHIHQMDYVDEREYDGVPVAGDTTFVPVGKFLPNPKDPDHPLVQPSITKVLLDFRHVPRGTFVFHCHMLYHEDHGMMGIVKVV